MSIKKRIENLEQQAQEKQADGPATKIRLRRGEPPIIIRESSQRSIEDCNGDDVRTLRVVLRKN